MAQTMLSINEERSLIDRWQVHKDMRARDRIIATHVRICYGVASRWTQNEAHIADLAQEGVFGLIRALDKFDPERGIRFSTYARWWIKTEIEGKVSGVTLSVDLPARVYRKARGAEPRAGEVDVVPWEARIAARGEVPLDAPVGDGQDSMVEMLQDVRPNPEQISLEGDRITTIKQAVEDALINGMTTREAAVLRRRDLAERPETLEVIAASLGISRERVRQIQNTALSKLRRHMRAFDTSLLRS